MSLKSKLSKLLGLTVASAIAESNKPVTATEEQIFRWSNSNTTTVEERKAIQKFMVKQAETEKNRRLNRNHSSFKITLEDDSEFIVVALNEKNARRKFFQGAINVNSIAKVEAL